MAGQISQSIVAAEVIVIFNNMTVGTANEFSAQMDYGIKPIGELDNILPREIIPGAVKTSFKISGFMSRTASLEDAGIFLPPGANIISNYVSIAIYDRKDQSNILTIPSAMIADISISVRGSTFMIFDISGVGFGCFLTDTNGITTQYQTQTPPTA